MQHGKYMRMRLRSQKLSHQFYPSFKPYSCTGRGKREFCGQARKARSLQTGEHPLATICIHFLIAKHLKLHLKSEKATKYCITSFSPCCDVECTRLYYFYHTCRSVYFASEGRNSAISRLNGVDWPSQQSKDARAW